MQVGYKTISSYEYDVTSGVFKRVETQVPDTSGFGESFADLLGLSESNQDVEKSNFLNAFESSSTRVNESAYASKSNLYAFKFGENENAQNLKKEVAQTPKQKSALNEILSAF